MRIRAGWGDPREPDARDLLFDSGKGLWRLYRGGLGLQFVFTSSPLGTLPYQMASFSPDFTEGEVSVRREVFAGRLPLYPLQYPLDELVMVHLLARGRGVAIHGSGVVDADGRGTLFAGQSGAGKTTMARLWLAGAGREDPERRAGRPAPGGRCRLDVRHALARGRAHLQPGARAARSDLLSAPRAPQPDDGAGGDRVDRAPLRLLLSRRSTTRPAWTTCSAPWSASPPAAARSSSASSPTRPRRPSSAATDRAAAIAATAARQPIRVARRSARV